MSVEPDQIVVLGGAAASRRFSPVARGSLRGFGVNREFHLGSPGCGGDIDLPLSLTVGAYLLGSSLGPRSGAIGFAVGPGFGGDRLAAELLAVASTARVGLLVMGDGSARRTAKAPGYLDPAAAAFDEVVEQVLRDGDGDALAELPASDGARLLAAGVPAWRAAGSLLAGDQWDAQIHYAAAPYGVGYLAASWLS